MDMMGFLSMPIPPSISPDIEYSALNFFFLNYSMTPNSQATCGFLDLLPFLYSRSSHSSPLAIATTAFAVNIYCLWGLCDRDASTASRLYIKAVMKAKEDIIDPVQTSSDDLLMTTLILEAYDDLNSSFQQIRGKALHAAGSVALIRHRVALNHQDELFHRIVIAVQNKLVRLALKDITSIEQLKLVNIWQEDGPVEHSPAIEADRLAFQYVQLKSQLHTGTKIDYPFILARAIALRTRCMQWLDALPESWRPISVSIDGIDDSVKSLGIYDTKCDVYINLSIANIRNWHRTIELGVLQIIWQCLNRSPDIDYSLRRALANSTTEGAQVIVDEICASIPFHAGNIMQRTFPMLDNKIKISFPQACVSFRTGSEDRRFPESESEHSRQVVSSGMWMIHGTLTNILRLIEKEPTDSSSCITIRQGQVEWIQNQILRLQNVFSFPVCVQNSHT